MNRRFFHRADVQANGELVWATKHRFGRVSTHREYVVTNNVSVDGASIMIPGQHRFPIGCRARLKLGLEFCDVEILDNEPTPHGDTDLRIRLLSPSARFIAVVEQWLPESKIDRTEHEEVWGGSTLA
ncbi:MAG: hypothetical protein ACR2P0_19615 [Acidimicrobiales bacterium]